MAKKRKPPTTTPAGIGDSFATIEESKLPPEPSPTTKTKNVSLSIPLGDVSEGAYISRRVDMRALRSEAMTLKRLARGLEDNAAELSDGTKCVNMQHALRWMLQQISK